MVYLFGFDVPIIPLLFGVAVGGLVLVGLLVYLTLRSVSFSRKLESLIKREREDIALLERAIARQEEDLRKLEREFLRFEEPISVGTPAALPKAERLRAEIEEVKERKLELAKELREAQERAASAIASEVERGVRRVEKKAHAIERGITLPFKSLSRRIRRWLSHHRETRVAARVEKKLAKEMMLKKEKAHRELGGRERKDARKEKVIRLSNGVRNLKRWFTKEGRAIARAEKKFARELRDKERFVVEEVVAGKTRLEKGLRHAEEGLKQEKVAAEKKIAKALHGVEERIMHGAPAEARSLRRTWQRIQNVLNISRFFKIKIRRARRRVVEEAEHAHVKREVVDVVETGRLIEKNLTGVYTCLHCGKLHLFKSGQRVPKCSVCDHTKFRRGGLGERAMALAGRV